jgi:hypothetical protein
LHFIRVSTRNPSQFRALAASDRRVRYVEPDPEILLIDALPNDPRFGQQYGPQHVRAPEAWDITRGGLDARVCVLDTGIRYTHEDIAGARWLGGTDLYNGDADPWDDNGHGTHVTGIAAASINNGKGIAGIANVGIQSVKVLSPTGTGPLSLVASGIRWCADNGGPRVVINMSLGSSVGTTALSDAVAYAYAKGALLVSAAGNAGPCTNCVDYPGKYPEVIPVTCTTSTGVQCGFSSDGPESELAAPGDRVLSSWHSSDTAYSYQSGTSMSTPHVSGVAALVWSQATSLTNTSLRDRLRINAQDLGPAGRDELYGFGLVDAKKTLDSLSQPSLPEARVYLENFDDGVADDWTRSGLWHVSSACSTPPSAPRYLGYNEDSDCDYSTGARTSGAAGLDVNLTGKVAATLWFSHRFEKESYATSAFDVMLVEVSTDAGGSWTTLRQWDSRNANQLAWTEHSVDLDAFAGRVLKLRFSFDSRDEVANAYDGWFLDNVEVTAAAPGEARLAYESLDDGVADGWSLTGLWHVSSACSTPPSAPNYLGFNEDSDCEYSTGARVLGMATFDVNLTGKTAATLTFAHRFEKESNTASYDAMRVRVSRDGGSTWTLLKQWDARDPNQLTWTVVSLDLDPYTGGPLKIRFYFDSVSGAANNFDGWFLDNIEVTAL